MNSHPKRWTAGIVILLILFSALVWRIGVSPLVASGPEDPGPEAESISVTPQRPTRELSIDDLLGKSLAAVDDEIGQPSVDNTLPANLSAKPPRAYSTDGSKRKFDDISRAGDSIVTAVCIDLSEDRIVYGIIPRSALSPEITGDLESGGLMADYRLREASGCGVDGSFSSINVYR